MVKEWEDRGPILEFQGSSSTEYQIEIFDSDSTGLKADMERFDCRTGPKYLLGEIHPTDGKGDCWSHSNLRFKIDYLNLSTPSLL